MEYELYHHGVKGMKWGVRRYQNYNGTYTKRGLERYRKAEADYDRAKSNAKKARDAYVDGYATRAQYKTFKNEVKSAKRRMQDSYDRLKTDKMADEGKELYRKGKTITGNMQTNAIAQVGVVVGSRIAGQIIGKSVGSQKVAELSTAVISVGGTAVNAILAAKTHSDNKKLRAYYGH